MRFPLAVVAGCMTLTGVISSSAAYASCATEAMVSPYAFMGTVISTEKDDRIATVITDGGRQVIVLGTPDTSWFSKSFSSADRRFAVAGRYEFHPINAEWPYRDNDCTATHQLAGPRLRPLEPTTDLLPAWLPIDEQAGFVGYLLFFGPVAAATALLIFVGRKAVRRFAKHRPHNGD